MEGGHRLQSIGHRFTAVHEKPGSPDAVSFWPQRTKKTRSGGGRRIEQAMDGLKARVRRAGTRVAAAVAAAVVLFGVVPGSLLATLTPPAVQKPYGLESEWDRLQNVREELVRRRALQQALDRQARELEQEIQSLAAQRAALTARSLHQRDDLLRLERELDRLVPRLLIRQAAAQERLGRAARLFADLAGITRNVDLDPTLRARMRAISPVMLRRLHQAHGEAATLIRQTEQVIEQHRRHRQELPILLGQQKELAALWQRRENQRSALLRRLDVLSAEVARLSDQERELAGEFLRAEAATTARAEPDASQPSPWPEPLAAQPSSSVRPAKIGGSFDRAADLARVADATHRLVPQVLAVRTTPSFTAQPVVFSAAKPATGPAPAKPMAIALREAPFDDSEGFTGDASSDHLSPLDVVFSAPARVADPPRLTGPALGKLKPIMPVPGRDSDGATRIVAKADSPTYRIAAEPGQPVLAPDDGRVVFAGPFKSYGLLLIIEHRRKYHTLLWGLGRLNVRAGDSVRAGQTIGVMGGSGERAPELHVELRHNGRPVSPVQWLAASNGKVQG